MATKLSTARTVKPAGETIQRLRLQKGWSVEEMAAKAGCTPVTVQKIEASKDCFLFTITCFSKAFGLPDNSLLLADPVGVPRPASSSTRVQLRIRLAIPFTNFDFTEQLVRLINLLIRLIDPQCEIEIVGVAAGSVVITLEMDAEDAKKTVSAFGSGELEPLHIAAMTTNFGSGELVEFTSIAKTENSISLPLRSQQPAAPPPPKQSLMKRLSIWLFGEGSQHSDPPPYREKGASIFERFKQRQD